MSTFGRPASRTRQIRILSSRIGVDADDRVGVVDGAREHPAELGRAHPRLERGYLALRFGDHPRVVLAGAEVEQDHRVVQVACQLFDRGELLLEPGSLARHRLGLLLVVPEPRGEGLLFQPIDLGLQLWKVKDAPLAP